MTEEDIALEDDDLNCQIKEATEEEPPMIAVDQARCLEVHLSTDIKHQRGSQVLKLGTEEYFRRLLAKEEKTKLTIKCLCNRIETLEKDVISREHALRMEKIEASVEYVHSWRYFIMEGDT